jgi:hypothetical protein
MNSNDSDPIRNSFSLVQVSKSVRSTIMMMIRNSAAFLSMIILSGILSASPFIDDMPKLKASAGDQDLQEWTQRGVKGSDYTKLMVSQPLVFLSEKNKYKGIQPDQMKLFADRVAMVFVSKMGTVMEIVDRPGPGVLVLSMAITELSMKKKRGLLGYSPLGAVMHAATSQKEYEDLQKLAKKIVLKDANLEIEMLDGVTGDRLAIRVLKVEGKQKGREEKSWEALGLELRALADKFHSNYSASIGR